jgi:hypothetical protein
MKTHFKWHQDKRKDNGAMTKGKVEGLRLYLGNRHVGKPIIYLENHLGKST